MITKVSQRQKRHRSIRKKIQGTAARPRMAVYKSNTAIMVQLIDDEKQVTMMSAKSKGKTMVIARGLGVEIAKKALEKGIKAVVFDRGGFLYHGKIKEVADGAREGGLTL